VPKPVFIPSGTDIDAGYNDIEIIDLIDEEYLDTLATALIKT